MNWVKFGISWMSSQTLKQWKMSTFTFLFNRCPITAMPCQWHHFMNRCLLRRVMSSAHLNWSSRRALYWEHFHQERTLDTFLSGYWKHAEHSEYNFVLGIFYRQVPRTDQNCFSFLVVHSRVVSIFSLYAISTNCQPLSPVRWTKLSHWRLLKPTPMCVV